MSHPRLQIQDLRLRYGSRQVLNDLHWEIAAAQLIALIGPNGSGKTSLLRSVAGSLPVQHGSILIDGHAAGSESARHALGYAISVEVPPAELSLSDCIPIVGTSARCGGSGCTNAGTGGSLWFGEWWHTPVEACSLGTRQKLSVLLALLGAPRLIVLDESLNGLDPASARHLKRHLRERVDSDGSSVILATHGLSATERDVDRVALLLDGQIAHQWMQSELCSARERGESLEDLVADRMEALPNTA
ncbi:MAG: ATP-binding cassette domain-containing protein [Xanthomonadales bacterium]|nr:ATP-binding cassette domain-containing protein [Xanthomonadales bacterium]